jgi:hypothetical protein
MLTGLSGPMPRARDAARGNDCADAHLSTATGDVTMVLETAVEGTDTAARTTKSSGG